MNATTADQLVASYLARLRAALHDLPAARREELLEQVSEHIATARAELGPEASEAEIRLLLERLGDPATIAAEAGQRPDDPAESPQTQKRAGWMEVAALILLPIGGIILPVLGWFVGVALLWSSARWTVRDKLIGTLVVPGGLALPGALGGLAVSAQGCSSAPVPVSSLPVSSIPSTTPTTVCTGGSPGWLQVLSSVALVVLVLAPLATVIYLGKRLRHQPNPSAY
jgi:uncharacterized membrane protein